MNTSPFHSDLPTVIYVDTSQGNGSGCDDSSFPNGGDMNDLMVDDDDMLDATADLENQQVQQEQEQEHEHYHHFHHSHHRYSLHRQHSTPSPVHHSPAAAAAAVAAGVVVGGVTSLSTSHQHHHTRRRESSRHSFQRQIPSVSFSSESYMFPPSLASGVGGDQVSSSQFSSPPQTLRRLGGAGADAGASRSLQREAHTSLCPGTTTAAASTTTTTTTDYLRKFSSTSSTTPCPNTTTSMANTSSCGGGGGGGAGGTQSVSMTGGGSGDHGSLSQTASVSVSSTHLAAQYMQGMRRLSRSIRHSEMTRSVLRREGVLRRSTTTATTNRTTTTTTRRRGRSSSHRLSTKSLPTEMILAAAAVTAMEQPHSPRTVMVADIHHHEDMVEAKQEPQEPCKSYHCPLPPQGEDQDPFQPPLDFSSSSFSSQHRQPQEPQEQQQEEEDEDDEDEDMMMMMHDDDFPLWSCTTPSVVVPNLGA